MHEVNLFDSFFRFLQVFRLVTAIFVKQAMISNGSGAQTGGKTVTFDEETFKVFKALVVQQQAIIEANVEANLEQKRKR